MEKKLDVSDIDLVSFEGFYQTIWDSSFEVSDYEYRNEVVEDEDFTFNEDSYQKAVCEAYTKQWERWLQQYVCKDIKLSFVGVQHPLAYNFSTDTIQVKIGLSSEAKKAIIAKVRNHREEIAGWIKENHSSSDGFWSFLSNDIKDREHAAYEARREAWKAKNPVPAGFKKVQNYTFQPGDIELLPPEGINRPDFEYIYRIYYKSFGRLCVCHCDAAGNRIYKHGCTVYRQTVAEAYVKKVS